MANKLEVQNQLWDLLVRAYYANLLGLAGHDKAIAEEFESYVKSSPDHFPSELEHSEKVYPFTISLVKKKIFKICFNSSVKTDREVEYFNRGCTLVRELLNVIFGEYNVLLVKNVKYGDEPDIDFSRFAEGNFIFDEKNVTDEKSDRAEGNFRYRIGFWVTIKDQIDKKVTNWTYFPALPVEFVNGEIRYNTDLKADFDENAEEDEGDFDGIELADEGVAEGTKKALFSLSTRLQSEEEKDKIFRVLYDMEDSNLKNYIDKRDLHARELSDCGEVVYRYNIVPLTIYLDRVQYKKYPYIFTFGNISATYYFTFNPTAPPKEVTCPNCRKSLDGYKARLRLALGKKKKPLVACTECTVDLKETEYYGKNELTVFTKDNVREHVLYEKKVISLHEDDTFISPLDHALYGKKCGLEVFAYYKKGKSEKTGRGELFPKDTVLECENCRRKFAVLSQDREAFRAYCLATAEDDKTFEGCIYCADMAPDAKPFPPRTAFYRSDLPTRDNKPLYFLQDLHAAVCSVCQKAVYRKGQTVQCAVCGALVCDTVECNTDGVCKDCAAQRANGTPCENAEDVWREVKSYLPLLVRKKPHEISMRTDIFHRELYYVFISREGSLQMCYCFEKRGSRYTLINRGGRRL